MRVGIIQDDGTERLVGDISNNIRESNRLGVIVTAKKMLGDAAKEFIISDHNGEWDRSFEYRPSSSAPAKTEYEPSPKPVVPPEIIDRSWTPARRRLVEKAKADYDEWLKSKVDNKPKPKQRRPRKKKYRLKGDPVDES